MPELQQNHQALKPHHQSGLTINDYRRLKKGIRAVLERPQNRVGLEGPKKHGKVWHTWLDQLIDGGLGKHFWGAEKGRKWEIMEDRVAIGRFMKETVSRVAFHTRLKLRKQTRRQNDHPVKQEDDGGGAGSSNVEKSNDLSSDGSEAKWHGEDREITPLPATEGPKPRPADNSVMHVSTSIQPNDIVEYNRAEGSRLYGFIRARLAEPKNTVGLQGVLPDREAWDHWFDDFLTNEVEANFWGGKEQKTWVLTYNDPTKIKKLVRKVALKAALSARNIFKKGRPFPGWQPRGDTNPNESPVPRSDGTSDSEHKAQSEPDLLSLAKEEIPHTRDARSIWENEASPAKRTSSPGFLKFSEPKTFMTAVTPWDPSTSNIRYEPIQVENIIPLQIFLQLLRDKHQVELHRVFLWLKIEIGTRPYFIDLFDYETEWDWGLILGTLKFSGIPDDVLVYVVAGTTY